jgi:hypothetical protein
MSGLVLKRGDEGEGRYKRRGLFHVRRDRDAVRVLKEWRQHRPVLEGSEAEGWDENGLPVVVLI